MNSKSVYEQMTKAEREVANELKQLGIQWSYEQPVFIWDENKRQRVWAPDFFLIDFGIYIEVCGSKSFDYDYRRKIFDKNGYRVIFLHLYKETDTWMTHLLYYIQWFTNQRYQKIRKLLEFSLKLNY